MGPPRPGPLLNRPVGDNCSQRGKPSQANRGPKNQGRSGWSVWWDKSLGAAGLYRGEIIKQLAAARAVITIWSPNSIKPDWVRGEAGQAKREGKLIPVKTSKLTYADIPLPFGEVHRECHIDQFNQGSGCLVNSRNLR